MKVLSQKHADGTVRSIRTVLFLFGNAERYKEGAARGRNEIKFFGKEEVTLLKEDKIPMRLNFHVHTDASDGRNSVEEIAAAFWEQRVDCFSVTDHNTVASIKQAKILAKRYRMGFLSGVELTAKLPAFYGARYYAHVLGYGIDEERLSKPLSDEKSKRVEAMYSLLFRLRNGGFDLFSGKTKEELPLLWSVAVYAAELMNKGYARTEKAAYRILESFGGGEVPDFLSVPETIARIHRAGGIAIWAHPYELVGRVKKRIDDEAVLSIYNEVFTEADGIEVYYQDYSLPRIRALEAFADARGLLKSVGTDFHALPRRGESVTGRNSFFFSKEGCSEFGGFATSFPEIEVKYVAMDTKIR